MKAVFPFVSGLLGLGNVQMDVFICLFNSRGEQLIEILSKSQYSLLLFSIHEVQ